MISRRHLPLLLLIPLLMKELLILILRHVSFIFPLLYLLALSFLSKVVDFAISLYIKRLFGLLLHLDNGCVLGNALPHHELLRLGLG